MVSELHRLGYQHLRFMPYEYPLAYRVCIGPRSLFSRHNGAFMPDNSGPTYSSAMKEYYFGWEDARTDDARALAEKFIQRFPREANAGRGRDWEYAGWLAELIGELEKGDRLPLVAGESVGTKPYSLERLPWIDFSKSGEIEMQFPLPPPGELDDAIADRKGISTPAGIGALLAQATQPNYLGSPSVVRTLVDEFIELSIKASLDKAKWSTLVIKELEIGRIFAGEDANYVIIGLWNSPEQLGRAIQKNMGTDLKIAREKGFARFITEGLCTIRDAARRQKGSEMAVSAISGYATAILLGYPVTETLLDLLESLSDLPDEKA